MKNFQSNCHTQRFGNDASLRLNDASFFFLIPKEIDSQRGVSDLAASGGVAVKMSVE